MCIQRLAENPFPYASLLTRPSAPPRRADRRERDHKSQATVVGGAVVVD